VKVHCYLGLVEPEELYADLVERSPWAEGEAAATVDAAVEAECQLWREQSHRCPVCGQPGYGFCRACNGGLDSGQEDGA
jgi:hypothetical protein